MHSCTKLPIPYITYRPERIVHMHGRTIATRVVATERIAARRRRNNYILFQP